MADTVIVITGGTLPAGYCPASYQTLLNDFVARLSGYVPNGIKGVVISATPPVAEDQDKLWVKLSGTSPVGQFVYDGGSWVFPHEVPASGNERRIWVGSPTDLETYDGGASGMVGPTTGPFWEVDADFAGRSPMGVGTMPGGTAIALDQNLGNEKTTQTEAQMPVHRHGPGGPDAQKRIIRVDDKADSAGLGLAFGADGATETFNWTQPTGSGEAMTTLSPVRGCHVIMRTARTMRVG